MVVLLENGGNRMPLRRPAAVIAWDEQAPRGGAMTGGGAYAAGTEVPGHGGDGGRAGPGTGPAGQNEAADAGSSTGA
jgi:hypothetical protein